MSLLPRLARRRPHAVLPPDVLALNLSFVLHERAESAAVRALAAACQEHAAWLRGLDASNEPSVATIHGTVDVQPDVWLSASLGLYPWLADALRATTGHEAAVVRIDDAPPTAEAHPFFRAEASLSLPAPRHATVGVASLVARPGRRDAHLSISASFGWPDERGAALRQLERLIQRDADQWAPSRALWRAPAEELLAGEVI